MLNKDSLNQIFGRMMATGGPTEDMERDIKSLQGELDEREGMLKKFGEFRDGENNSREFVPNEFKDYKAEYEESNRKYNDLMERYTSRFLGNYGPPPAPDEPPQERPHPQGINALFKPKERN